MKKKTQRTNLSEEQSARLENLVSLCDAADMSEEESMALINSGYLGYKRRTKKEVETNQERKPLTIQRSTYYKFKKLVKDPAYQKDQIKKYASEDYVKGLRNFKILIDELVKRSIKNLLSTKPGKENQQVINGITRNLPYYANYSDVVKKMIEKGKIPLDDQR